MSWTTVQLKWIRDRREATRGIGITFGGGDAPWPIRMFGERGMHAIGATSDYLANVRSREELQALFPEAQVIPFREAIADIDSRGLGSFQGRWDRDTPEFRQRLLEFDGRSRTTRTMRNRP